MKISTKRLARCFSFVLVAVLLLSLVPVSLSATAATGKTYYVSASASGSDDGLSADHPFSLLQINAAMLKPGDKVLFKRGDVFYGSFAPVTFNTDKTNRVTIATYGAGARPIISGKKIVSSSWTKASGGFYRYDLTKDGKYTGLKNNDANIGFFADTKGNIYGTRRKNAAACVNEYEFYCDSTSIYVKSSKDPYAALGTLYMCTSIAIVALNTGMDISDLHVEYGGFGMFWNGSLETEKKKYVTIRNCIIENIGGYVATHTEFTRLGNGIELYGDAQDVVIEGNLFRNTFDVAFTCQSTGEPGNTDVYRNIKVENNIFAYCCQSMEIFTGSTAAGAGVNLLYFRDNLSIGSGEGWATGARTNKWVAADILAYGYPANTWRMFVQNNTFFHSDDRAALYSIRATSAEKFIGKVTVDNNYVYHLDAGQDIFRTTNEAPQKYQNLSLNFAQWKEFSGKDTNTKTYWIGNSVSKYAAMEKAAATSLNFNDIIKAAKAAGVTVTVNYSWEGDSAVQNTTTKAPTSTTKAPTSTTKAPSTTTNGGSTTSESSADTVSTTVSDLSEPSSVDSDETAPTTQQADTEPKDDAAPDGNLWLIIGIVGGVVLLAAVAVIILLILKKKKSDIVNEE